MSFTRKKASSTRLPFIFLTVILLIYFLPLFSGLKLLSGGDLVNQYIPYKYFLKYWIRQGVFPLWNPLIFCGRPYVADIQLGNFYPPNFLHLLLPPEWAFTILTILHLLFAFWGGYILFYRPLKVSPTTAIITAIVFVFSGFFLTRLYSGIVLFIYTATWTPFIFYAFVCWLTHRRIKFVAWSALLMAMQLLAGAPQIALISNTGLAFFFVIFILLNLRQLLNKKRKFILLIGGTVLIAILTLGLCAVQLLPTYEFMRQSFERSGKAAWEYVTTDSLRPRFLLTWFFPDIFYSPTKPELYWGGQEGYWEINAFISIPAVVLVVFLLLNLIKSRRAKIALFPGGDEFNLRKTFFISALLFLIIGIALAFGRYSPVYYIAYHFLPLISKFRVPARWIFLYSFALAILTAFSLETLIKRVEDLSKPSLSVAIFLLILIILFSLILIPLLPLILEELGLPPSTPYMPIQTTLLQQAKISIITTFTFAIITSFILLLFILRRINLKTFIIILGILITSNVFIFGIKFIEATPSRHFQKMFYPQTPLISLLKQNLGEYNRRLLALDDVFYWINDQNQMEIYPDRTMVHNLNDARGYDPVYIRSFGEFMNALAGRPIDKSPGALLFINDIANPLPLNLLNVNLLLTYHELHHPELRLLKQMPFGLIVYENAKALGGAFIATAQQFTGDKYQLLSRLCSAKDQEPVLTADSTPLFSTTADNLVEKNLVRLISFTPNKQIYEVAAKEGNILVFSENYYPGWQVLIDGKPEKIVRVNHTFSGVFISPGKHRVVKFFRPSSLILGSLISLSSLILTLLCFLHDRKSAKCLDFY